MKRVLLSALACLLTGGCVRETAGRPHEMPASAASASAPLPMPSTAFRADDERDGTPSSPSRFETRRIGSGDDAPRRRYRGAPIDLDLKNADLAEVFRLLADVGHVNIVVSGEVSGTITLRLRHVPWDQALEVIAQAKSLGVERDGNVLTVTTPRKP